MPTQEIIKDAVVTLATVDWSAYVTQVGLKFNREDKPTTNMASGGAKESIKGIHSAELTLGLNGDVDQSTLDAAIYAHYMGDGKVAFTVKGKTGAIATTNVEWQGFIQVNSYTAIEGTVGDLRTMTYTWPLTGTWTRDTTA
jgi:hypothetical protein